MDVLLRRTHYSLGEGQLVRRAALGLTVLAATAFLEGCADQQATLIVTLNQVPEFATTIDLTVSGIVTRTPLKETTILVTVSGGASAAVDTAGPAGDFSLSVTLVANSVNTLTITAQDAQGNVSEPAIATVTHDGTSPTIASMTPARASDGVSTGTTIEVRFSEPVRIDPATENIRLVTPGQSLKGLATLSADSLTLTFTPPGALRTNSVYELLMDGIRDVAGNRIASTEQACFVTELSGAAELVIADSTLDYLWTTGTSVVSPSDLVEARFGTFGELLTVVLEFTTPRQFDTTAVENLLAFIEFDIDQDSTTGFTSAKDLLFTGVLGSSGTGVEYVMALDLFDSAYVARYIDQDLIPEIRSWFRPGICAEFAGLSASFADLGGDDGDMDFVITTWNVESLDLSQPLLVVDPTPTSGHYTLGFSGLFPVPPPNTAMMRGPESPRRAALWLKSPPRFIRLRKR